MGHFLRDEEGSEIARSCASSHFLNLLMGSPKILFLLWPETSAYNATFQLARALTGRGYQVTYAVPERWVEVVARQGFQTVTTELSISWPLQGKDLALARQAHSPPAPGCCAVTSTAATPQTSACWSCARSLGWIKTEGFACVLVYTTLWQHALALRQLGIPFISMNPSLAAAWRADVPPIFSSLQPDARRPY